MSLSLLFSFPQASDRNIDDVEIGQDGREWVVYERQMKKGVNVIAWKRVPQPKEEE